MKIGRMNNMTTSEIEKVINHILFTPTSIDRLDYYSTKYDQNIYAKRDDLGFLTIGGGSKARMLQYLLYNLSSETCDVLVTAGGPCSNFNRACSLFCAKRGVRFHLVEYSDNPSEFETSLNYKLCKMAGMESTPCSKDCVPETIAKVMGRFAEQGIKARFIYGGGKSLEGIYSYYDAIKELKEQNVMVDYLFVACGTGTTLTGICAGMQKHYPDAEIHAISTARSWEVEKSTLKEDMQILNSFLNTDYNFSNMSFHEEFLCGGYAKFNQAIKDCIHECISKEGMLIDSTYSGKAFYGMTEVIKDKKFKGKNILFWNTGGMFNLLSDL